jgi:thiol:disulfide interchange protein DsbC
MTMKTAVFSIIVFLGLLPAFDCHGFSDTSQDCTRCHTLSRDEAVRILKSVSPDLKVLDIRTFTVRGLWEVAFDTNGKKGITYIDFPKKHIVFGNIFTLQTKRNITQERLSDLTRVDISQIPLDDAVLLGNADATKKVVVFSDPY